MVDVILVGLLVNLAASALFYSFQGRLDNLKHTRPLLAHSLGGIFLILAFVAFWGIRMLSKFSVDFEETKIHLPYSKLQIYHALLLPLSIMLFSSLEVPSNILSHLRDEDRSVERAYRLMRLTRPFETAFLLGAGIVGYKMALFSSIKAENLILLPILILMLMAARVKFRYKHNPLRFSDWFLLTLMTTAAWSCVTLIFLL